MRSHEVVAWKYVNENGVFATNAAPEEKVAIISPLFSLLAFSVS